MRETESINTSLMTPSSRIFVAGHRGLVGSAIVRRLEQRGYHNLIAATREDLDLRDQAAVSRFFARHSFREILWSLCGLADFRNVRRLNHEFNAGIFQQFLAALGS